MSCIQVEIIIIISLVMLTMRAVIHTRTTMVYILVYSGINIALTVDYANVQVNHYDMSRNTQLVFFYIPYLHIVFVCTFKDSIFNPIYKKCPVSSPMVDET